MVTNNIIIIFSEKIMSIYRNAKNKINLLNTYLYLYIKKYII